MDTKAKEKILKIYGNPVILNKEGKVIGRIARQTTEDASEIEKMTTNELVQEWKGLVWLNHIYGQVDLNELQRINLLELEMDERKVDAEPLKRWYGKAKAKQDLAEQR